MRKKSKSISFVELSNLNVLEGFMEKTKDKDYFALVLYFIWKRDLYRANYKRFDKYLRERWRLSTREWYRMSRKVAWIVSTKCSNECQRWEARQKKLSL